MYNIVITPTKEKDETKKIVERACSYPQPNLLPPSLTSPASSESYDSPTIQEMAHEELNIPIDYTRQTLKMMIKYTLYICLLINLSIKSSCSRRLRSSSNDLEEKCKELEEKVAELEKSNKVKDLVIEKLQEELKEERKKNDNSPKNFLNLTKGNPKRNISGNVNVIPMKNQSCGGGIVNGIPYKNHSCAGVNVNGIPIKNHSCGGGNGRNKKVYKNGIPLSPLKNISKEIIEKTHSAFESPIPTLNCHFESPLRKISHKVPIKLSNCSVSDQKTRAEKDLNPLKGKNKINIVELNLNVPGQSDFPKYSICVLV
jgi:hypothetical protein